MYSHQPACTNVRVCARTNLHTHWGMCVRACVRVCEYEFACVRACVHACVCLVCPSVSAKRDSAENSTTSGNNNQSRPRPSEPRHPPLSPPRSSPSSPNLNTTSSLNYDRPDLTLLELSSQSIRNHQLSPQKRPHRHTGLNNLSTKTLTPAVFPSRAVESVLICTSKAFSVFKPVPSRGKIARHEYLFRCWLALDSGGEPNGSYACLWGRFRHVYAVSFTKQTVSGRGSPSSTY